MIHRSPCGHRCGASHYKAKLPFESVKKMRHLYGKWKDEEKPLGYTTLANLFGCGVSTARDIVTYRTRVSA